MVAAAGRSRDPRGPGRVAAHHDDCVSGQRAARACCCGRTCRAAQDRDAARTDTRPLAADRAESAQLVGGAGCDDRVARAARADRALHAGGLFALSSVFAVTIDKADQGRMMVLQRVTPDSNGDLRISLNSSAFGPGEYRLRLQGYTWQGRRVDAGWIRLRIKPTSPPQ